MDKDFHYYGTYTAARLAGFSPGYATIIAHSAQYVDDSTNCSGRIMRKGENGLDFQPQPTYYDAIKELGWNVIKNPWRVHEKDVHRVFMSFHFLPGNYRSTLLPDPNWQSRMRDYSGPQSKGSSSWTYDDHAKAQFQILCLPRSPLAAKIVNEFSPPQNRPSNWLHMLGIRMHAYADTGAHMHYAGTPAWHVNDPGSDVYDLTVVPKRLIKWVNGDWMAYSLGVESCTPPWPTFDAIFYLGHGRIGHVPDYPWIKYEYQPEWSSKYLTKDNPAEYMRTFLEMILVLQYQSGVRGKIDYSCIDDDIKNLRDSISEFLPAISDILSANPRAAKDYDDAVNKRCALWRKELDKQGKLAKLGMPMSEYDPDAWVKIARESNKIQDTDYYKFNSAAIDHSNFVRVLLQVDGIKLADWGPLYEFTAAPLPDKRLQIWVVDSEVRLWSAWKQTTDSMALWTNWSSFQLPPGVSGIDQIAAASLVSSYGRGLLILVVDPAGELWSAWEGTTDSRETTKWSKVPLPPGVSAINKIAIAQLSNGWLEISVVDSAGVLWSTFKVTTDSSGATNWSKVPLPPGVSAINQIATTPLSDERSQIWVVDGAGKLWEDSSALRTNWSTFPLPPGISAINQIAIAPLSDGMLQMWAVDGAGRLWSAWRTGSIPPWTDWSTFPLPPGVSAINQIAVAPLSDGRLQIWVVDSAGRLWSAWKQTTDSRSQWTAWSEFQMP